LKPSNFSKKNRFKGKRSSPHEASCFNSLRSFTHEARALLLQKNILFSMSGHSKIIQPPSFSFFSRFSFWKGHHVSPKFRKGLSPKFHKNLLRLISPFFIVLSFSFSDSFVLFYCCAIRRLSYSVQSKLQ